MLELESKPRHRQLYLIGLYLFALGLPMSKPVVSFAQFVLLAAWIYEGNIREKFQHVLKNKILLFLVLGFMVQLLWIPFTEDLGRALQDLRIKLPLLTIPILTASIWPLARKEFVKLLDLFALGVSAVALIGISLYFFQSTNADARGLSPFISHIRMGILCVLAIFSTLELVRTEYRWWRLGIIGLLLIYLILLQGLTALILLSAGILVFIIWGIAKLENKRFKWPALGLLICTILSVGTFLSIFTLNFQKSDSIDFTQLDYASPSGEVYLHLSENLQRENGHYIWTYVAMNELRSGWNELSELDFDGLDEKGQPLHATIIRFMASKNLRKDLNGLSQLKADEIRAIEQGLTNIRFVDGKGLSDRLYETLWELEQVQNSGNPSGNSVAQRFEFWSVGWTLLQKNPLLGIGAGNLVQSFDQAYEELNSELSLNFRKRAHNQYLTYLISFGWIGGLFILASFFHASIRGKQSLLSISFFVLWTFSFVNEDTLETQIGASFFIFFLCLYAFNEVSPKDA
ncbi:MAG TPA: hypothetical protein DCS15_08605 [Flavobacteriales bacterium]|nr:O-antigen ligase family protein [Salibacteraceae bacterium]HAS36534.1 hypothetical protein [Flavobacteriales bacterium]